MPDPSKKSAKKTAKQLRDGTKKAVTLGRRAAAAVPGSVLTSPVMRPVWLYLVVLGYVCVWWLTGLRTTAALIHVPVCVALLLFGAGWVQFRTYLSRRSARVGILWASAWLVYALAWPGVDAVAYGWVTMLVLSAAYRQHHDPGVPGEITPDELDLDESDDDMDALAEKWTASVATKVVPGSVLTPDGREQYANRYVLQLDPDHPDVTLANLPDKLGKVGHVTRIDPHRITVEPRRVPGEEFDPTVGVLRRVTRDVTAGRTYEGPVVENGRIVLGPHIDGHGDVSVRLLDQGAGRCWSCLIIGETGSGKSRCEETISIGAVCEPLVNPAIVVYIDPQEGGSSQALWDHSAKAVSMNGAAELLMSVKTLSGYRQQKRKKLASAGHKGLNGFWAGPCTCKATDAEKLAAMKRPWDHSPDCWYAPWVVVVIDEVHNVTKDAECRAILESGSREDSKNGIAYVCVTQSANLEEGIKSPALRDNLAAGNTIGMRTLATSIKRQLGLPIEPSTLPAPGGMVMQQKRPEDRPVPSMLVCPINPENTKESWADRWLEHYGTLVLPPDELAIVGEDWLMGKAIEDGPDLDGMTAEQIRDFLERDVRERVLGERQADNGNKTATTAASGPTRVTVDEQPATGTRDAMKERVANVVRSAGEVFRTADVAVTLDIAPQYAAALLRDLETEGHVRRVKKGHWQRVERQDLLDLDPDALEDIDLTDLLSTSGSAT